MRSRWVPIAAGLIALCLVGAAFLLFQVRTGTPASQRTDRLQHLAQNAVCLGAEHVVPGSYQADPPQTVGDWVVVTYTAVCAGSGQTFGGYVAEDRQGGGCNGASSIRVLPVSATSSGPVTIALDSPRQCPGKGGLGGLSIISGNITGQGPASAQVLFGAGAPASAPIRGGRFVVLAPNDNGICTVRALDVAGAVLAELKLGQAGAQRAQGACP